MDFYKNLLDIKDMKFFKICIIIIFVVFSNLTNIAFAESLKFSESTYEGEVKKGKADGIGVFTFSDGSTYEGKVSKNRIHGKGKYTDSQGKTYEGKFRYGTFKIKIDAKTREVIKIKPKTGLKVSGEVKGAGKASVKWFEAVKNSSGTYEMSVKGEADMKGYLAGGASGGASNSGGGC